VIGKLNTSGFQNAGIQFSLGGGYVLYLCLNELRKITIKDNFKQQMFLPYNASKEEWHL
jgi:hypothetical protein